MSPRASAPEYLTFTPPTSGEFLADSPEPQVLCGVCRADFTAPHNKAQHLAMVHGAVVHKRIDAEGNDLYTWSIAWNTDERIATTAGAAALMRRKEAS